MSATTIDVGVVPDLNEQQVQAILAEALKHEFFELDVDGQLPRDPKDQKAAATELVRQARLSYAVGNRSSGVTSLLFIAEVDQHPPVPSTDKGENMPTDTQVDLSSHSDEAIQKFEQTLLNYDQNSEEVQENLAVVRAEMKRRGMSTSEQPQTNGHSQVSAVAKAEEPEPTQDPRKALEDRLTFSIMRAHGIDPSQVSSLSDVELEWVVTHPGGEGASEVPQPQPEEPKSPNTGESVETTHMVVNREPEPTRHEPAAVVSDGEGETRGVFDADREELESQVTGPMLKAYGRGRKDVPEIGSNELRFMIENPDGRVTQEQLLAARALDEGGDKIGPEPTAESQPTNISEQALEAIGAAVEKKSADPEFQERLQKLHEKEAPLYERLANGPPQEQSQRMTKAQAASIEPPSNPAQEIIDQENFPVPPEIDERPPRLPYDLSKVSDDELRSFHARFHACQSRANYVVGLWEGNKRDIVKLIRGREVEVANNLPTKDPEDTRKRITDAQREAMVAADPQVIELKNAEHSIDRILRQLKALADGYARDVSTCSRQWSMRKGEAEGAAGLR